MVKLFSMSILYKQDSKIVPLCSKSDLTQYRFFQRNSVQEFMNFTCHILVERCPLSTRISVMERSYMCHVYVRSDGLSAAVISDQEYPNLVAHTLLSKLLEEFSKSVSRSAWNGKPNSVSFGAIETYFQDYQDPRKVDGISRIREELDETKIILHNTIESLLQRGEKMDDLVSKSEQLGLQSKAFYENGRRLNSCCGMH